MDAMNASQVGAGSNALRQSPGIWVRVIPVQDKALTTGKTKLATVKRLRLFGLTAILLATAVNRVHQHQGAMASQNLHMHAIWLPLSVEEPQLCACCVLSCCAGDGGHYGGRSCTGAHTVHERHTRHRRGPVCSTAAGG